LRKRRGSLLENLEEIESQTKSGHVFDEQEREAIALLISMQTGLIQSNGSTHCLHKGLHCTCSNQAASISALLDCVLTYLLNQGFSSEGQERRYVKAKKQSVAENAIPACVVPLSFLAKGNREERVVV
jgi:hypothetical protein